MTDSFSTDQAAAPVGPYPHARRHGDTLYLSGIGPRRPGTKDIPGATLDADGKLVDWDIDVQTRAVVDNLRAILAASGSALEKVIDVQVFLIDMARDFQDFNKVYGELFGKIRPTRTTIEVGCLPTPIAVELKVIAAV